MKCVVVGAGFGGLAAALRLRARGSEVLVVERQANAGGRGRELTHTNDAGVTFRYDAGPTVLTAPILFEELFTLFGEKLADHLELLPVAPWYRMQFADGSQLDYGASEAELVAEIAKLCPADAERYPAYRDHAQKLFDKGYLEYGAMPFDSPLAMLRALPHLLRLRADRTVYQHTAHYFSDERVRRAFSIQPLLVGGNPFETTSIYGLIHALERKWGVWFPRGGTAALVDATVKLAERHGVQFRFEQTVTRVELEGHSARALLLASGERIAADRIVMNADPCAVYKHLIAPGASKRWTPRKLDNLKMSMGLFVWYFSTKRLFPEVKHHTILFGDTYREALADVFDAGKMPVDLNVYLHRPTASDAACAPAGCDSFYALVPVPNLQFGHDWAQVGPKLRNSLAAFLSKRILPGFESDLVDEFWLGPEYFKNDLLSEAGAGFSLRPTLLQSAGFRFFNRCKDIQNLYFVGAGTHPGAGVPGVVTSAKVVEKLMFGSIQ